LSEVYLSLGSNIGDSKAQLERAVTLIDLTDNIIVTKRSKIIKTKPWGNLAQNIFHNMAIEIETNLYPEKLLSILLQIEDDMGRKRNEKWGPRVIDIDIIAFEQIEAVTKFLTLPHKHAFERDFVLIPLREISPKTADWIIKKAPATSPTKEG